MVAPLTRWLWDKLLESVAGSDPTLTSLPVGAYRIDGSRGPMVLPWTGASVVPMSTAEVAAISQEMHAYERLDFADKSTAQLGVLVHALVPLPRAASDGAAMYQETELWARFCLAVWRTRRHFARVQ